MEFRAVIKDNASLDVYYPRASYDMETDGTVVTFEFKDRVTGFVVPGAAAIYLTCRTSLKPLSRVANLTDIDGTALSPHRHLYITETKPEMDFTGNVFAWRYTLKSTLPRDVVAQVEALDEFADAPYEDLSAGHI